jgi:hypothetical protein
VAYFFIVLNMDPLFCKQEEPPLHIDWGWFWL